MVLVGVSTPHSLCFLRQEVKPLGSQLSNAWVRIPQEVLLEFSKQGRVEDTHRPHKPFTWVRFPFLPSSGYSSIWKSTCFGSKTLGVQIPLPRLHSWMMSLMKPPLRVFYIGIYQSGRLLPLEGSGHRFKSCYLYCSYGKTAIGVACNLENCEP